MLADQFVDSFAAVKITENVQTTSQRSERTQNKQNVKLLYVDALNFATLFFPLGRKWNITQSFKLVRDFVKAATKQGITLKCFIDDCSKSQEAVGKYRKRRELEVVKGQKNIPQGLAILLGDMFRAAGVEVCYSSIEDNDDCLASHAETDGADILSNDKDMFRYTNHTYTVYGSFNIDRGRLMLIPKEMPPTFRQSSPLAFILPPPVVNPCVSHLQLEDLSPPSPTTTVISTASTISSPHASSQTSYSTTVMDNNNNNNNDNQHQPPRVYYYLRGVPTPLLRFYCSPYTNSSPHRILTPLRRYVFYLKYFGGGNNNSNSIETTSQAVTTTAGEVDVNYESNMLSHHLLTEEWPEWDGSDEANNVTETFITEKNDTNNESKEEATVEVVPEELVDEDIDIVSSSENVKDNISATAEFQQSTDNKNRPPRKGVKWHREENIHLPSYIAEIEQHCLHRDDTTCQQQPPKKQQSSSAFVSSSPLNNSSNNIDNNAEFNSFKEKMLFYLQNPEAAIAHFFPECFIDNPQPPSSLLPSSLSPSTSSSSSMSFASSTVNDNTTTQSTATVSVVSALLSSHSNNNSNNTDAASDDVHATSSTTSSNNNTSPSFIKKHEWQKHQFCMRSLVYETCSLYTPNNKTLLDYWLEYESSQQNNINSGRSSSSSGSGGGGNGGFIGNNNNRYTAGVSSNHNTNPNNSHAHIKIVTFH